MDTDIAIVGDEALSEGATTLIDRLLNNDEILVALGGFDFETKVIAITDLRVIITSGNDELVLNVRHNHISSIRRDGRTLVISTTTGVEHRHRFGRDETVQELVEIATQERPSQGSRATGSGPSPQGGTRQEKRAERSAPPIAERIRFWEEQDRINQELIPRVIRQHELLTKHISDHEVLPIVAAAAAREAVEQAQGETLRQLEETRNLNLELADQLEQAKTERVDQNRRHEEELSKLRRERLLPWVLAGSACAVAAAAVILAIVI